MQFLIGLRYYVDSVQRMKKYFDCALAQAACNSYLEQVVVWVVSLVAGRTVQRQTSAMAQEAPSVEVKTNRRFIYVPPEPLYLLINGLH